MSSAERSHVEVLASDSVDAADLPEGWCLANLPDICAITMGQSPPGSTYNDDQQGLPFFQGKAEFGPIHPTVRKWCSAPTKIAHPGDILISVRAPVGPTNIADCDCAIGRGLSAISPLGGIPSLFILYALRLQEKDLAEQGTGSTFTAINRDHLEAIDLGVPPLAEQKRIVAKVEELLARVNAARERLARVPAILKRFRQSILAAACSGRLTEDWRDRNPNQESASALLARIRVARAAVSAGRVKANSPDQDAEPEMETPESPLPESWAWCRVEELATVKTGGTPPRKEASYWGGEVSWVSSGEVANCRIGVTRETITAKGVSNSNAKAYPPGTVLVAMIGEGKTRGQAAILDIGAATNQNVAALVFDAGNVEPDYVWRWALGEYEKHRAGGRGGNYPALNGRLVRKFVVPLPPLAEQEEVVQRVDELFELSDAIERRVATGIARAEKLVEVILAKAFRGELVPTEAELARAERRPYEPASALLARVRSSQAAVALLGKRTSPAKGTRGRGREP